MNASFQFRVSQQQNKQALLTCLASSIPYLQPSQWLDLLASGYIKVNGNVTYQDANLQLHDYVEYVVPNYQEAEVDTNWTLLWQNQWLAAVHKPANLPVSRTTRNVYNTLVQLLRRESPWPDAHLLHRLDLETSGIILIAHDNEKAKHFQPRISELMSTKVYRAIVYGEPAWQEKQHSSYLSTKKESPIRCQMHSVESDLGKLSKTNFTLVHSSNGFSIIECELLTGRKHQIRAHLAQLGHPIVGDKIYSEGGEYYLKRIEDALTEEDLENWPTDHHLLHAQRVELKPIWDEAEKETVLIEDLTYPQAWLEFCEKHDLKN